MIPIKRQQIFIDIWIISDVNYDLRTKFIKF